MSNLPVGEWLGPALPFDRHYIPEVTTYSWYCQIYVSLTTVHIVHCGEVPSLGVNNTSNRPPADLCFLEPSISHHRLALNTLS
jgi:hypothetical protein